MPLHGLQLVAAAIGLDLYPRILLDANAFRREFPVPTPSLFNNATIVFVDAGTRSEEQGAGASVYAVKLAVLARHYAPGGVEERILHPLPAGQGGSASLPLLIGSGGERVRQAASYIVELASLLAVALNPSLLERALREAGVDAEVEPERLLLVRHGPLLQMLSQYLSTPYVVDTDTALSMLLYAGLDKCVAYEVLERSYACQGGGSALDRNRVVLGLLALHLLDELAELAAKGSIGGVAGIVENVSRSRLLVARLVSDAVREALGRHRGGVVIADLAAELRDAANRTMKRLNQPRLDDCLCPPFSLQDLLDSRSEWEELLTAVRSVLEYRFKKSLVDALKTPEQLEAAATWSGSLPLLEDSDLVYTLYYLVKGSGLPRSDIVPVTTPSPHTPRLEIMRYYLNTRKESLGCTLGQALEAIERLRKKLVYQYIAPTVPFPESCADLAQRAASLSSIKPCDLSNVIMVPPTVRLEYVDRMKMEHELKSLAYYSSSISLYGYPPPLLVVDRYSRISPQEITFLRRMAEELAARIKPYSSFIRSWETRIESNL